MSDDRESESTEHLPIAGFMDDAVTIFTARYVQFERLDDGDVDVLCINEDPEGAGRHLIFERAGSFSDQDCELGMDTYAVTNEHSATVYGVVSAYSLGDEALILKLTSDGSSALGLPRTTRLGLKLPPGDLAQLRAGLRAVVGGSTSE
jgi:Immunity protein 10